jgi:hypothetical protein
MPPILRKPNSPPDTNSAGAAPRTTAIPVRTPPQSPVATASQGWKPKTVSQVDAVVGGVRQAVRSVASGAVASVTGTPNRAVILTPREMTARPQVPQPTQSTQATVAPRAPELDAFTLRPREPQSSTFDPLRLPVLEAIRQAPPPTALEVRRAERQANPTLNADQRSDLHAMRTGDARHAGLSEIDAATAAAEGRPLSAADRANVQGAQRALAAANIRPIARGPNQVQIEIAFDGTGNDASVDNYQTNPAQLHQLFDGNKTYVRGVGTNATSGIAASGGNLAEGARGIGMENRIEQGYDAVVAQVNEAKRLNPNAEVSVVVTGFSRGAATARQFVNVLNERGIPNADRAKGGPANFGPPRVGALVIFDTVDSHDTATAAETIPPNVDNVLHLVSRDEHRPEFPLTTAVDRNRPDPRVTEIALPGAHSDVGGGYPNGFSNIGRDMAYDYMARAGVQLKPQTEPRADVSDPNLRLHDSSMHWFDSARDNELGAGARVLGGVTSANSRGRDVGQLETGRRVIRPSSTGGYTVDALRRAAR